MRAIFQGGPLNQRVEEVPYPPPLNYRTWDRHQPLFSICDDTSKWPLDKPLYKIVEYKLVTSSEDTAVYWTRSIG